MRYFHAVLNLFFFHFLIATLPRVRINEHGHFEANDGRTLIFHGTSYVNVHDDVIDVSDENIELAAKQWGFTVARVGFLWNLVEPEPGVYNASYLSKLFDLVQRFANHGIFSILDMHQDLWSPLYCGHGFPSFYAYPYNDSLYQKDGPLTFPVPLARPQYAPDAKGRFPQIKNCEEVGNGTLGWIGLYGTFSLGAAAQRLYDNDDALLDKFGDFWRKMAVTFRNQTAVLGYELLNEPWLGDALRNRKLWNGKYADKANVERMHKSVHEAIRTVDNETIIFFEPATGGNILDFGSMGIDQGPGGFVYNDRQALSYHVYCPMLQVDTTTTGSFWRKLRQWLGNFLLPLCNTLNNAATAIRENDIKRFGCGGLLTEFGSVAYNDSIAMESLVFTMEQMDSLLRGWVYWKENPSKDSDPLILKALSRTYAKAIAGTPTYTYFSAQNGEFVLRYKPSMNATVAALPTEIFAAFAVHYPNGLTCVLAPANAGSCVLNREGNSVVIQLITTMGYPSEVEVTLLRC